MVEGPEVSPGQCGNAGVRQHHFLPRHGPEPQGVPPLPAPGCGALIPAAP